MVLLSGMREGFCEEHAGGLFHTTSNAASPPAMTLREVRIQDKADQQKCMRLLWGLQAGVAVTAVVTTTAQWMLAMRIRGHAKSLAQTDLYESLIETPQETPKRNVIIESHDLI